MKTINHILEYESRSQFYKLFHITDTHIGAAATDEALLKRDIKRIYDDPNACWGHGGDILDCISRTDKRYRENSIAPWLHGLNDIVQHQLEYALDLFRPIAHKCLYIVSGNHESHMLKQDRDVYRIFVREMAVGRQFSA